MKSREKFLLDASLLYKDKCPELSRFLMQRPMEAAEKTNQKSPNLVQSPPVCPHCYQWLQPDNQRVRLRPKQRPSARMQSVLRRQARGKRLSLKQKELLHRFQKSCSLLAPAMTVHLSSDSFVNSVHIHMENVDTSLSRDFLVKRYTPSLSLEMATCHTCHTTSRHKGMNREFLANFAKTHSTPGSVGKHKTPQSASRGNMNTQKTPSKDKTPAHTPRSSISSSTSGSGSSSSKSASKTKNWVLQRLSKILIREDNQGSKKGGLKDFLSSL